MTAMIAVLSLPCASTAQVSAVDYGPCAAVAAAAYIVPFSGFTGPFVSAGVAQGTPKAICNGLPFVNAALPFGMGRGSITKAGYNLIFNEDFNEPTLNLKRWDISEMYDDRPCDGDGPEGVGDVNKPGC